MKNKFVIPLFVVMLFSFGGCNDDSSSATKTITMEVNLTDTHGNSLEVYPIGDENLNADTLLRSKKILQKVGDSIVLGKEAIDLIFHITTNASWKLSKQKPWGDKSSITWFTNPQPTYGGGNSTSTTSVKVSSAKTDRRVYIYFTTGDSACVKKYVFLQEKGK